MMTRATTDFQARRTVRTLKDFAERFPVWPYTRFQGVIFAPFFYGAAERPAFRVSGSLADQGEIVTAWPDGRIFSTQGERDRAALECAHQHVQDDLTWPEALAYLRDRSWRAARGHNRLCRAQVEVRETVP